MTKFKEFNFSIVEGSSSPEKVAFLKRAYKSKMTCSEFIEEWAKLRPFSRGKQWNRTQYTNPHKAQEQYYYFDEVFNFFGNHDE